MQLARWALIVALCGTAFSILTACAGRDTYLNLELEWLNRLLALVPQYPELFAALIVGGVVIHMNHERWTMPVEAPPPPPETHPPVYSRYHESEPYGSASFASPYEAHVAIEKKDPRLNLPQFED